MPRRELKPRTSAQYSNAAHGGGRANVPDADRTINREVARVNMFNANQKGPLICRPLPALQYEDPSKIAPGRNSVTPHDQSVWITRVPVMKYCGTKACGKYTFIRHDPSMEASHPEIESDNPSVVLYRAANDISKAWEKNMAQESFWNPALNALVKRGMNTGADLSRPDNVAYFAAGVYAHGDKKYYEKPMGMTAGDDLTIVSIPFGTFQRLLDLLDRTATSRMLMQRAGMKIVPGMTEAQMDDAAIEAEAKLDFEANPHQAFYFGDPTGVPTANGKGLTGGLIFTIFYPKQVALMDHPSKRKIVKLINGQQFWLDETTWDGSIPENIAPGYEIAIGTSAQADGRKISATLTEENVQFVKDKWQFWWDDPSGDPDLRGILKLYSINEQCQLLARGFASHPDLFRLWQGRQDFLTPEVLAILKEFRDKSKPGTADELNDLANYATSPAATGGRPQMDPYMQASMSGAPPDSFDAGEPAEEPAAEELAPMVDSFDTAGDLAGEAVDDEIAALAALCDTVVTLEEVDESATDEVFGELGAELADVPADEEPANPEDEFAAEADLPPEDELPPDDVLDAAEPEAPVMPPPPAAPPARPGTRRAATQVAPPKVTALPPAPPAAPRRAAVQATPAPAAATPQRAPRTAPGVAAPAAPKAPAAPVAPPTPKQQATRTAVQGAAEQAKARAAARTKVGAK